VQNFSVVNRIADLNLETENRIANPKNYAFLETQLTFKYQSAATVHEPRDGGLEFLNVTSFEFSTDWLP